MSHKQTSVFLQNVHHAYAQTDGTYAWPNSREGYMLKQAKNEIEALHATLDEAKMQIEIAVNQLKKIAEKK